MAGDIIVNIYTDGSKPAGPCGGPRRTGKDHEREDCIEFEAGYPKCLEGCIIEARVKVNDSNVAQVYFTVVLEGLGFPLCFSFEEPKAPGTGTPYWGQSFICLFCGGSTFRVYAAAYDAMGNFLCEISKPTNACPGFLFDKSAQEEIVAFKKQAVAKRREHDQAIVNEAKKLYEQLRNKARQPAK